MTGGPTRALLPDGRRLHLQHGPIDLVIEAFGPDLECRRAYSQAWHEFQSVLPGLAAELPALRRPVGTVDRLFARPVARRMQAACRPHKDIFVTPMAAVAGAVADHVLAALVDRRSLRRAYVNNGGDIALHLAPGEAFNAGIVGRVDRPALDGAAHLPAEQPVRGIATSGRDGRSFSLGIADSVTVLGSSAAAADVAATLIGNAVNCEDPAIRRAPANTLAPDSDLGDRPVTMSVGPLGRESVDAALEAGAAAARTMLARGLIHAALLTLDGDQRIVGDIANSVAVPPHAEAARLSGARS